MGASHGLHAQQTLAGQRSAALRGLGERLAAAVSQRDLHGHAAHVLRETGLDPSYLELELTESMVMHDGEEMIEALRAIQNLGVHMSVDDFGTGYSSLSYLKRFPVDRLKIDRSFVSDMTTDADSAAIVRTINALGHNLGLKVLAEGVETDDQVDFLLANDCDELQGYWFSRPVSSWRLRGLLTQ